MFLRLSCLLQPGIGKEIQQPQPLSKQEGATVTFQCRRPSPEDLSKSTFDFKPADENFRNQRNDYIYSYKDGKEHPQPQMPEFINRTYLSYEDLRKGVGSITITQLRISDSGNYKWFFPKLGLTCIYTLTVEKRDSNNRQDKSDPNLTNSPSKEATTPDGGAQWSKVPVPVIAVISLIAVLIAVLIAALAIKPVRVRLCHGLTAISGRFRSRNDQPNSPERTPMNGSQPMDEHENTNGSSV
ncbi:uncharacterized protein LOC133444519 [Cololabis saira]|uniref:uncharacterized protein LOC133444519 n=1 Tax=Cololabis saira TaxID=129043 RepID=UPI002AD547C6|nr:uncharacterized protein LOC133444519 [Cololabis saira]